MIEFVTLFLALTSGPQPVALAVEEPVARVELLLDGRQAVRELREDLDSQSVVWLEGSFLPQEIELSAEAQRHVEWLR